MRQRRGQGTGTGTTLVTDKKARAAANIRATAAILATRVVDEHDDEQNEAVFADGALEPPELEDLADSSAFVEPSPPGAIFDRQWSEDLPLAGQLPSRLRPPVRYRIDAEGVVHAQYRRPAPDSDLDLELAVARAIARHIQEAGIRLESAGDWCKIPAIGVDEDLEGLDEALVGRMHSLGSVLKAFAIELPSRDVVVPDALIRAAGTTTKATLAGALRMHADDRLEELLIDSDERARFAEARRREKHRAATSSAVQAPETRSS